MFFDSEDKHTQKKNKLPGMCLIESMYGIFTSTTNFSQIYKGNHSKKWILWVCQGLWKQDHSRSGRIIDPVCFAWVNQLPNVFSPMEWLSSITSFFQVFSKEFAYSYHWFSQCFSLTLRHHYSPSSWRVYAGDLLWVEFLHFSVAVLGPRWWRGGRSETSVEYLGPRRP